MMERKKTARHCERAIVHRVMLLLGMIDSGATLEECAELLADLRLLVKQRETT